MNGRRMVTTVITTRTSLLILFVVYQNGDSKQNGCINCFGDCDGCERILDNDLLTFMTMESGTGRNQRRHRLQIAQECVNTSEVEFRAVLGYDINCSELSFLFVNQTNEWCRRMSRCQATEIMKNSKITSCLIKCPKRTGIKHTYEVTLIYGLLPATWFLRDLRIHDVCDHIWTPPIGWPETVGFPVLYQNFENPKCFVLENGAQLVEGKVGKGVSTNREERQWIDLGDVSEACLADPESCPQGATLSGWIKIKECDNRGGILGGNAANSQGFKIQCALQNEIMYVRYVVSMSMKSLRLDTDLVLDTWFHTALVFRRPQPDISVSINGMEYREYDTKNYTYAKARGNMVIGKRNTDRDSNYASVNVDELLFWNVDLTQTTIEMLISDTH